MRWAWADLARQEPPPAPQRLDRHAIARLTVALSLAMVAVCGVPLRPDGAAEQQVQGLLLAAAVLLVTDVRRAVTATRQQIAKKLTAST
ncbi:hypothetical protein ACPPVS_05080 [Cellulomonas sp. McL0617]|uniref:hypothetical protein n=1 Tax=Cellulomonas sp. McL0617 TaxID=3415675 RepID=UPI003CF37A90